MTPESTSSYREILRREIEEGLSELNRPTSGLLLSGLSAGLDIGFGPFLMAVVLTMSQGVFSDPITGILLANAYAVGFIFVVVGRSELFTEHTTLAVVPVLNGQGSLTDLARLWGVIYVANLVGGAIFAGLAVHIGVELGTAHRAAFVELGRKLVAYSWSVTLLAGVLAGWLMGLMTWLVAAGQNTISQAAFVWIVAVAIGLSHLPHSIAGSIEVLMGVFVEDGIAISEFLTFLVWSTIGNVIGGTIFVGLLKYGHGVRPGAAKQDINVSVERTRDEQQM
ncbi:formate/nitrite transporter family protein [Haloarcula nitratireducens]|uniref:Formate/nitrite transporter family protein n=1 Tax=Haloarcula nitratireducens TaxID=2487749 RepID=A0AAW4PHQ8_9EURY|nr:formate/nitrite transporter family protein [Halomicroarcula nitratireducens]MBX0297458.1 formate/nitrite transporter family protein [Halomicroarcula nitratireducens]